MRTNGANYLRKLGIGLVAVGFAWLGSASPSMADQVFLDDIIVDGSACIGFDCVNGESFGFDTLRLKENNLRIKAQDTSTTSSFPTNDWQITFNDTSNGGANKFSIDDIDGGRTPFTIEAGAPSHSLYVEDGGRVGFGTNTPVVDLHVKSGNTPTLRLEQDGSSGFGAQTWDVAGNEANFFIRDASNGSTLPFRIFPGAPSNALTIEASTGDIGMGTTSPDAELHVAQTDNGALSGSSFVTPAGIIDGGAGSISGWVARSDDGSNVETYLIARGANNLGGVGTGTASALALQAQGTTRLMLNLDNSMSTNVPGASFTAAGVWTDASSRKLKENIAVLTADEAFEALTKLEPVTYNYKVDPDDPHAGFIAEDVPDIVATPERNGLSALDIVAVLTKVVKEQNANLEQQHHVITTLSMRVAELEAKPAY